jgi:hypothetical protein
MATRLRVSRWAFSLTWAGTFILAASADLQAQHYESPPEVLSDIAARGAADIDSAFASDGNAATAAENLEQVWDRMVFYTVADALPGDELHQVRGLRAYRYLAEVTRTDKQVGSTASGPGSTTLSQKPGIAELLAFAIEHGAIEQSTNGTGVTLSTSPYAFVRLIEPDNAENFDRFGFWRRIGASATLDTRAEDPATGGGIESKQLAEWSVRFRLLGDRSTRSSGFTRKWKEVIQPKVQTRLNALSRGISATIDGTPGLRTAADSARDRLRADIESYLGSNAGLAPAQRVPEITRMMLDALQAAVFQPVDSGKIQLSERVFRDVTRSMSQLVRSHQELFEAQTELGGLLDELDKSLLLTLEYTHHAKAADLTGFSDMRLLFEDQVAPFTLVVNAFLSVYDDPDEGIGQEKVRDYGASFDIEGEVGNPFGRRRPSDVVEPITLSVGYQLSRLEEGEEMVHIAQAKARIPISAGVTLPLAVTYASRGVLIDEEHVRGNFGFSLDLDKFYAISKAFTGN